jgi:hypothetical protein
MIATRPRPSIEMRMSASFKVLVKAKPAVVNACEPSRAVKYQGRFVESRYGRMAIEPENQRSILRFIECFLKVEQNAGA